MILNWNKSLGEKNDKILWALSLKNIPRMKDGEEKGKREGGEKRKREIIDVFYPEAPPAGFGSLLCFLWLSLVLFPSFFFVPSITHCSAVSSSLSPSHVYTLTPLFFSLFTFSVFSISVITDPRDSWTIFILFCFSLATHDLFLITPSPASSTLYCWL